jgi:hypothetical protein
VRFCVVVFKALGYVKGMVRIIFVVLILGLALGLAQSNDYKAALTRLYAASKTASFLKDWCLARAPETSTSVNAAYSLWYTAQGIAEIESRISVLLDLAATNAKLEESRSDAYSRFDTNLSDPSQFCSNLSAFLQSSLDLRRQYAADYTQMANVPFGSPQRTPSTSSPATTPPPASSPNPDMPSVPPADPIKLLAADFDAKKEPTPDEYRCYAKRKSDQYNRPDQILQILPKRQYRFLGSTGAFKMQNDDLIFTSGVLASQNEHFLSFRKQFGTQIWLYNIGTDKTDYRCHQRGAAESLALLEFKRKDPPVGTFTCAERNNPKAALTQLEVRSNRQYRYAGQIGRLEVDILGDQSDDYSTINFVGGVWDDENAFYEEDEYGQQSWQVYANPRLECLRQTTPRPNPKFGSKAAPKPPAGYGGIAGRFYTWRIDIPIGGMYFCGGLCYDYAFFDKSGYVFVGDPEDTEGTEDNDCSKTYPSGYPICELYKIAAGKISIGTQKPVLFKTSKQGIQLDGDDYEPLLPLGNLKLQGTYHSFTASGSTIGAPSSFTSSVDFIFSQNGKFTRDASNSAYVSATSDGTAFGSTIASSSAWSQRRNSGTYKTYGNTLELKFLDGRVVKKFMFLVDKNFYRIGGRDYTKE